jgi:hypothetical protein
MMTRPPAMRARLQLIAASLALYLAACALPALRFTYDNGELQVMPGFAAALMGWTAMFVLNFGWLANVAYFPGLLMFLAGWWTAALAASITALLLALQSLMLWGVTIPADEANVAEDESRRPRARVLRVDRGHRSSRGDVLPGESIATQPVRA